MLELLSSTFIIERICGSITYMGLMLLVYILLRGCRGLKNVRYLLNFYLIILVILAFFYVPGKDADLPRLLLLSENWKSLTFSQFCENVLSHIMYPVAAMMMYVNSMLGNGGLLPAFAAFITFYNIFYILLDLYKRHDINEHTVANIMVSVMIVGSYLEVISGIRSFMAMSIVARYSYDELYNGKVTIKSILMQVCAVLIHPIAAVYYTIKLLMNIFLKSRKRLQKLASIILLVVISAFAWMYGKNYILYLVHKGLDYITKRPYRDTWETIIGVIQIIIYIFALKQYKIYIYKTCDINSKKYFQFLRIILVIAIIFSFEYNIFHRTCFFLSILMCPILSEILNKNKNSQFSNYAFLGYLIIGAIAMTRGNLSGFKFFLLT